jgi:hypothetical protein
MGHAVPFLPWIRTHGANRACYRGLIAATRATACKGIAEKAAGRARWSDGPSPRPEVHARIY